MTMSNLLSSVMARRKLLCASLIAALTGGAVVARAWQDGPDQSRVTEASTMQTAKERELAVLLQGIQGIEFAAVEYNEKKTAFMRDAERTAKILLRSSRGAVIHGDLKKSVAKQATQHFVGLTPENVTIAFLGRTTQQSTDARYPEAKVNGVARFFNVQQTATGQARNFEPAGANTNYAPRGFPSGWDQRAQLRSYYASGQELEQDGKIRELLNQVKSASKDKKAALTEELTAILSQQFDQRHASQEKRLDALKASVDEAQAAIDARAENRDKIIERRAKELLGESDPLSWDYGAEARFPIRSSTAPYYTPRLPASAPLAIRPSTPTSPGYPSQNAPRYTAPTTAISPVAPQAQMQSPGPGVRPNSNSWTPAPQNSMRVLQSQVESAKAELEEIEGLHRAGAISTSELRDARASLVEAQARFNSTQQTLQTRLQSAKIDLEAQMAEMQILREQQRTIKSGTSESYAVEIGAARAKANIQKAELELALLARQMEELKALEKAAKNSEDREKPAKGPAVILDRASDAKDSEV